VTFIDSNRTVQPNIEAFRWRSEMISIAEPTVLGVTPALVSPLAGVPLTLLGIEIGIEGGDLI